MGICHVCVHKRLFTCLSYFLAYSELGRFVCCRHSRSACFIYVPRNVRGMVHNHLVRFRFGWLGSNHLVCAGVELRFEVVALRYCRLGSVFVAHSFVPRHRVWIEWVWEERTGCFSSTTRELSDSDDPCVHTPPPPLRQRLKQHQ